MYFCEDHFDLPNDMENYMEYHVMGSVLKIRLKPGCIPSKFKCHAHINKRTYGGKIRPYSLKKRKMMPIEECIGESVQSKADSDKSQVQTEPTPVIANGTSEHTQEVKQADPVQAPETGGGEAPEPVSLSQEISPVSESTVVEKPSEIKPEPEVSKEDIKTEPQGTPAELEVATQSQPTVDGDWQQRETELLKKIEQLEKVKSERSEDGLRLELKVREEEIDLLKARVRNLETELQAALSKPSGKNHELVEKIKQQHEELLSKARGMIFDKTKMVKNQELQIEALTAQVQSLKDINLITKDLLQIRNAEVKAMEERFQAMEARFKAEKERYGLVLQRAHTSTTINDDLRREYETQLAIFKELREKYELRVQALVEENGRLKEAAKATTSG
ncbi:unnamed protein product, partial [Iphiclides podalirius]